MAKKMRPIYDYSVLYHLGVIESAFPRNKGVKAALGMVRDVVNSAPTVSPDEKLLAAVPPNGYEIPFPHSRMLANAPVIVPGSKEDNVMPRYIDADSALQAHPEFLNEHIDDHDKAVYAKGWNDCNKEYYNAITELPVASMACTDLSVRLRRAFEADELTNHRLLLDAADAIEELLAVCRDIAAFVIHYADDDEVSAEVLCRKLHKIGVVEKDGAWWTLADMPKEVE